ncbi:MAG: cobyric acid synthase [Lachnospiraceae bacterium]|nr:cobyric acid synthase [Lachnospiraceae bacterium]
MAYKLMVQGTTKGSGKSFVVIGLLQAFKELGFKVAPFKTVEISDEAFVTKEGADISKTVATLSFAAKEEPSVYMNPIFLRPATGDLYHVSVNGEPVGNMSMEEFLDYQKEALPKIKEALAELEKDVDVIIMEGDRSPAELDYKENDVSNIGLARLLNIPVLLVGDASLGGVLASLHGTIDLLPYDEKRLIKGILINKYDLDNPISDKAQRQLETRSGKKVLAKIPVSEAEPFAVETEAFLKPEKSIKTKEEHNDKPIDVAIIKLPRMSNYPDFDKLEQNEKFNVRYVRSVEQLKEPELLIIPGTKSTIPDLRWIKAMGFKDAIRKLPKTTRILGICGGFQMLGHEVLDPFFVEGGGTESGLSLLPIRTTLREEKLARPSKMRLVNMPKSFEFLEKVTVSGQEVNGGEMEVISDKVDSRAFGTYLHGFFDEDAVIKAFERGFERLEIEENDFENFREIQFDKCKRALESSLDFNEIEIIIGMKKR